MLAAALQYCPGTNLTAEIPQGQPNSSEQTCWGQQSLSSTESPALWTWEENCMWLVCDEATHLKDNISACRSVCSWQWSLCTVLGVLLCFSMDTWTGGWHSLFLALLGQLIHLLFLAGFTRSNPQFLGREGIQETEKDIGVMSKGSKLEHQHEHGRFQYRAVCLTRVQSFRQVCFAKDSVFSSIRVWWQKSQPSSHENVSIFTIKKPPVTEKIFFFF